MLTKHFDNDEGQGSMDVKTRPVSLKEQQRMFDSIYGERNGVFYSTPDIYMQITERMSKVSESLRKERWEEMPSHLPMLYGWLMALWNRIGVDIAGAAWFKYPGVCPYCLREKRCMCITEDRVYDPEGADLDAPRKDVSRKPTSVAEWQEMFSGIYGKINKIKAITSVWFHFVEEVGEVSCELRHQNEQGIRDESADAFAWFLAFCSKLDVDIDDLVWMSYPGECNTCREDKCVCEYE